MRVLQILALLASIAVAVVTWMDYRAAQERIAIEALSAPLALSQDVESQSAGWSWSQSSGNSQRISIRSGGFRQDRAGSGIRLTDVRLEIQHPESGAYDRVITQEASFNATENRFYSEGRVVVTLGLPAGETPADESEYTHIVTSGATFNTQTGEVWTDQPVEYAFEGGRGSSIGARYSSLDRRFTMNQDAFVERFPNSPTGLRTEIRGQVLHYYEAEEHVRLEGGCSLERGSYRIGAETADVFLKEGAIREILATKATGVDRGESREVRFTTPHLRAVYAEEGWIEQVIGEGPVRMSSITTSARSTAEGDWMQLTYAAQPGESESLLSFVDIVGKARILSGPLQAKDGGERRVESEQIHLQMRPDGEQVAYLETIQRGSILISPNTPTGSERRLDGDALRIDYGPENRMEKLTARGAVELTDTPQSKGRAQLKSWSETLNAAFDPQTGELTSMTQRGGMRFVQTPRKGGGTESAYEPALGRLTLTGKARVEQPGAAVTADKIVMTETTGEMDATGKVAAQYSENGPATDAEGLFEQDQPVFAAAEKMTSNQGRGRIVFEGGARLWQKVNRVEANRIVVDRKEKTLEADGAVRSTLRGQEKENEATVVQAKSLIYREKSKTASYRGEVRLAQKSLRVRGDALDADLTSDEGEGSSLKSAEATGGVEVEELDSHRKGYGDKAFYEAATEKVTLTGKPARALNERGEETRGARLTYKIDAESLLVEGGEEPAYTVQRQSKD